MDDATAIEIADARMASTGLPLHPVRAGVVTRKPNDIVEVSFAPTERLLERGFTGTYRVFLSDGFLVGTLLNDGTPASSTRVDATAGESPIETAIRCIETIGRICPPELLTPAVVDPTQLMTVYYAPTDDNMMGGDYTVYIAETGVVVEILRGQ